MQSIARKKDVVSSVVVFAGALWAFLEAESFSSGAAIFPKGVAGLMMILSVIMFMRAVAFPSFLADTIGNMDSWEFRRMAIAAVGTVAYILLIIPIGFVEASILYMLVNCYGLKYRNYKVVVITSVVFAFLVSSLFQRYFHTPWPEGVLSRLY